MALNHVLIVQPYSRRRELQESYLNIFYLPIFDRFMAYRRSKSNFGPNVIYCFFVWECGGPHADEADLEVYFGIVLGFTFKIPHICFRSTSSQPGWLGSQPRRHRPLFWHITNGTKPFECACTSLIWGRYRNESNWTELNMFELN